MEGPQNIHESLAPIAPENVNSGVEEKEKMDALKERITASKKSANEMLVWAAMMASSEEYQAPEKKEALENFRKANEKAISVYRGLEEEYFPRAPEMKDAPRAKREEIKLSPEMMLLKERADESKGKAQEILMWIAMQLSSEQDPEKKMKLEAAREAHKNLLDAANGLLREVHQSREKAVEEKPDGVGEGQE